VDFRSYPPFDAGRVQRAIAEADGWRPDGVLVGNGSNELLTLLFRSVLGPGERVVRPSPCFSLYPLHLDATGAAQSLVHLKADDDFAWPVDELVEQSRSAKVVVVTTPNNPTGSVLPPHAIDRLLRESNALIVIDEAYRDFCEQDFVSHLQQSERVVLLRTFSKAMAMAGLRFGYLLGAPALCRELLKVLLPYNVSTLTQDAALAVLARRDVVTALCARVRDNRSTLTAALRAKGRRVIEGGANFVLMGSPDPKAEFKALLAQGVLVRDLSSAVPGFLRVSVGTPAEHARLLAVLPELSA
jgi:histidinol-phosphate aminotransferase